MAFGNGPRIVTDGLVMSLDAADRNSYVSGSTIWNNLAANQFSGSTNGTLIYSSSFGGGVNFTTIGTYLSTNIITPSPSTTPTTYEIVFTPAESNITFSGLIGWTGYQQDGFSLGLFDPFIASQGYSGSTNFYHNIPYNTSSINYFTAVYSGSTNYYYIKGVLYSSQSYNFNVLSSSNPIRIGGFSQGGWNHSRCTIHSAKVYNRALSAGEIQQNFNAQKSRFGL